MMEGWKTDKLMNLVSSITTGKLDANAMVPNGQYRFYTCAKEFFQIDKYAFDDEALLISGNGEYVGYIHYYKGKFNAYQRVYVITGFKIDVKYLQNFLNRYLPIRINKEVSQNNIPYIRLSTLSKMDIKYPESKSEQSAIAAMLSKVDEAIASVQASISAAERLKKSLMQNLLTGRMKPDGTLRKEDEFYLDEKFGRVPLGWEVKKVGEIAENLDNLRKPIKSIDRDKIKGKIPYYGAAGIVDYINDYLFDGTYLLFGEDGENLLSRKVPQAFIVKGKFWVNNHAHILRVYNEFDINLIVNILESKKYDDIVYGSAQPKINKSDLNRIKIIIPKDIDEQKRISKSITTIDIEISTKQSKIAVLERLKKSLMQNLLTGKVRVNKNK